MFRMLFGRKSGSPQEAHQRVAAGATLLDVRTREEFAQGHVEGARNIPLQELGSRMGEIPKGDVVVYCRSGARSALASTMLRQHGYEVLDIGPMSAWSGKRS